MDLHYLLILVIIFLLCDRKSGGETCEWCPVGTYFLRCDPDGGPACRPCPSGTFTDKHNHQRSCQPCRIWCFSGRNVKVVKSCSSSNDLICECVPGYYAPEQMSQCYRHKQCKAGEGVIHEGTPTTNTICGPCPNGTFSAHESLEDCKPWTACGEQGDGCILLYPGNSTHDNICGRITKTLDNITDFTVIQCSGDEDPQAQHKKTELTQEILEFLHRTYGANITVSTSTKEPVKNCRFDNEQGKTVPTYILYILLPIMGICILVAGFCMCRNKKEPAQATGNESSPMLELKNSANTQEGKAEVQPPSSVLVTELTPRQSNGMAAGVITRDTSKAPIPNDISLDKLVGLITNTGHDWERFLIHIGINQSRIDYHRYECKENRKAIQQCLREWLQQHPGEDLFQACIDAANTVEYPDIADEIQTLSKQGH